MPIIRKHSISIKGHRTSFSLEDVFYHALCEIAEARNIPLSQLIASIDQANGNQGGLSSALRVYVFEQISKTH